VDELTFHSAGNFFPPPSQVLDATGGNERWVKGPAQPSGVIQDPMHLQGVSEEIMCRAFPTTLKQLARIWFSKLTPNTISTFKELSEHFVTHFIEGQRYKRSSTSLLNIKQ